MPFYLPLSLQYSLSFTPAVSIFVLIGPSGCWCDFCHLQVRLQVQNVDRPLYRGTYHCFQSIVRQESVRCRRLTRVFYFPPMCCWLHQYQCPHSAVSSFGTVSTVLCGLNKALDKNHFNFPPHTCMLGTLVENGPPSRYLRGERGGMLAIPHVYVLRVRLEARRWLKRSLQPWQLQPGY